MWFDEEVASDVTDRRWLSLLMAPDGQEELVLGRRQARFTRLVAAPFEEGPEARPKLEQARVVVVGQRPGNRLHPSVADVSWWRRASLIR